MLMSKQCMMRREKARDEAVAKYAKKREELRLIKNDPSATLEEKLEVIKEFSKLPRDSAANRKRNRCWMTGRGRGVYRSVGICRNMFRIHAMQGDIPGIHKASW
jgi:small subunit ribosomal protein S14